MAPVAAVEVMVVYVVLDGWVGSGESENGNC